MKNKEQQSNLERERKAARELRELCEAYNLIKKADAEGFSELNAQILNFKVADDAGNTIYKNEGKGKLYIKYD